MSNRMDKIPVSEKLGDVFEDSMEQLRKEKKQKKRNVCYFTGAVAAVLVGAIFWGTMNPEAAEKIPFVGHIFEIVEDKISYKGNYSERAEQLVTSEDLMQKGDKSTGCEYVKEMNGITVTVSEIYHDYAAMYMTVQIQSEVGFSEEMMTVEKESDYKTLNLSSESKFDFCKEETFESPGYIEGKFVDKNNFIGVVKFDLHNLRVGWPNTDEIEAGGVEIVNSGGIYNSEENLQAIRDKFPDARKSIHVPDKFVYDWKIMGIFNWSGIAIENNNIKWGSEEAKNLIQEKGYIGEWEFHFEVELDTEKCDVFDVNATNEFGEGFSRVIRTPYEITADIIIPDEKLPEDYNIVFCDANGDPLSHHGAGDSYDVEGYNLSTVYVFLCDSIQYPELCQYGETPEYQNRRLQKTYAQYLQEYALYSTVVHY